MPVSMVTIREVLQAQAVIAGHISAAPLIRSYVLERELGLPASRRIWLKDFGWTPVGSFKLLGALNWMAGNLDRIGDRPVAAHSSGIFASGIAFAGDRARLAVRGYLKQSPPRQPPQPVQELPPLPRQESGQG